MRIRVHDKVYIIPDDEIPRESYLSSLLTHGEGEFILSEDRDDVEDFDKVYDFLMDKVYPGPEYKQVLDYLSIDPSSNYTMGVDLEDRIRHSMYLPEYEHHPVNTEEYYGLIKLDRTLWDSIKIQRGPENDMLFTEIPLVKRSWDEVVESLKKVDHLISPNVIVAGGRVLHALFGTGFFDIDMFIYGVDKIKAEEKIYEIMNNMGYNLLRHYEFKRRARQLYWIPTYWPLNEVYFPEDVYSQVHNKPEDALDHDYFVEILTHTYINNIELDRDALIKILEAFGLTFHREDIVSLEQRDFLVELEKRDTEEYLVITRTHGAVSFRAGDKPKQVVLRLYKRMHEILHGFDVDCCGVGYDGKDIWITQRALYAICNGINTVNFNRLSPSYEYRLAKYGTRGFAVRVPSFNREDVQDTLYTTDTSTKRSSQYKGLDLLLYLEQHAIRNRYANKAKTSIARQAEEKTDYGLLYISNSGWANVKKNIRDVPEVQGDYPEFILEHLYTKYLPKAKSLPYIKGDLDMLYPQYNTLLYNVLHINDELYKKFGEVKSWEIPKDVEWKVINPGEQTTGTFHRIVLENPYEWYNGEFYRRR